MEKIRELYKSTFDPATLKLVVAFAGSLIIYILAFTLPANLLILYNRTALDGQLLQDVGALAYLRMILAFSGLALLYFMGIQAASQTRTKAAWFIVISGILAFILVLILMAPYDALDIYDNIFHGRIVGIYGGNPFRQLIMSFPNDPFYSFTRWKTDPSAYGPVWELLAGLTARLAGDGIIANILAFKLLPGLFHLASVVIVVLFLRRSAPEQTLSGMLLVGWNPVILYETWGNGHNDIAMVFWIVLAVFLINRRRYTLATLSLVVGTLIKFIPVLLIPSALLVGYCNTDNLRTRLWFLVQTLLGGVLMTVAAYLVFWNGVASLSINRRMQMFSTSIPSIIVNVLYQRLDFIESARIVSLSAFGLLVIFIVYELIRFKNRGRGRNFAQTAFNILAFYLMVTCLWFQQWYGIWLIGLAPMLPSRWRSLALLFGFWVLSKQFIFGPLIVPLIALHPRRTGLWLEPILTMAVLGVPWIYVLLNVRISSKMKAANYAA